jgi:signal transduction histidine kinase
MGARVLGSLDNVRGFAKTAEPMVEGAKSRNCVRANTSGPDGTRSSPSAAPSMPARSGPARVRLRGGRAGRTYAASGDRQHCHEPRRPMPAARGSRALTPPEPGRRDRPGPLKTFLAPGALVRYHRFHPDRGARSTLHPVFFSWKRLAVGTAVISVVAILQVLSSALVGERVVTVYTFAKWVPGVPLHMLLLFVSFSWAARRRLGSALMLLTSFAVTTVVGALGGVGACFLLRHHPHLLPPSPHDPTYAATAGSGALFGVSMCGLWALAFVYPFAADDARLRALEAEKLKIEASSTRSTAELARLRAQLEPHFMLNTLNAIAGLVTQDPREARRLIGCLGDLLRDALTDGDEMQTLGEEIAWLRRYAEILESRHAGSLRFQWEIARGAEGVLLPRLLLQPLVENAVKHGALRRDGGGQVLVRAAVTGPGSKVARLVCTVEDNGPGMPAGRPRDGAFGLRSVQRRIDLSYVDGSLRLESSPRGTCAVVDVPYAGADVRRPASPGVEGS